MSEQYIGNVAVDSGQVMIVDPCYVTLGESYEHICEVTLSQDRGGTVCFEVVDPNSPGHAVAVAHSTRNGDGVYPVYAELDSGGQIVSLRIVFGDHGESAEDECWECGGIAQHGENLCKSCQENKDNKDKED